MLSSSGSPTFYSQLQKELENLPGEDAHVEMLPLRARTSDVLKTATNYRPSAVMALLYERNNQHHIILTERQDYDGKHSGQMSFPGGKKEEHDSDALATALRETEEEIGIQKSEINVIGKLTDVYIPVSNFLVHPYLGCLKSTPRYLLNEREVKSIVSFEIRELLNKKIKIETDVLIGKGNTLKNVPAFYIEEKIIWGATALMLNELKIILNRINY
jgi:8-oxo-dGTP pyrophosphatase MutT (NUDIX family)